jgi:hypothetical protein
MPLFIVDADLDPTFHFDADPDPFPIPRQTVKVMKFCKNRSTKHQRFHFESLCPPLLQLEPPQLLNFDLDVKPDPDPAFDFDADPDPAFIMIRIRILNIII